MLRTLLYAVPLAWVLGGGCSWAYSSGGGHDDHDDDGTTVVVVNGASSGSAASAGTATTTTLALDPELFRLGECSIEFATPEQVAADRAAGRLAPLPLFRRVTPREPATVIAGVSAARVWPPERIGEHELAAFTAGVLSVNHERLHLPAPLAELQYLDTLAADGRATVRFGQRGTGLILSASFGPTGELISIERLPGHAADDRGGVLR